MDPMLPSKMLAKTTVTSCSSQSSSKLPQPAVSSSHRKAAFILKSKLPPTTHAISSYFVLNTILPSHVVKDQSLFMMCEPSHRVHRTAFGTDITIEGIGNVDIHVLAGGQSIIFTVHDCWHIPSSPHHFLSCLYVMSPLHGHQVMLAGRTPRLLFPHKHCLAQPNLPKYVPFSQEQGYFVLKFDVPTKICIPWEPTPAYTSSMALRPLSLQALSYQLFAGLTFI